MEEYDISEDENEILTAPVVPRLFSMRENFDYPLCSNAIDDLFRNVNMRIKPNN